MKVESNIYRRPKAGNTAGRRGGVAGSAPQQQGNVVISNVPPPELANLQPQPPQQHQQQQHLALPGQSYQLHHGHPQQHMILSGVQQQKLIRRGHQLEMLQQAKLLCDHQDFVDVTIYCEDGVVRAHQLLLAVASPFLKHLFETSPLYGIEDICIILPETKACLVQALIHFVYTGTVVSKEDHFYSLMKLVYALSINASIEAESTTERPTSFTAPLVPLYTVERVRRLPHGITHQVLPGVSAQHLTHLTLQQQQQNVSAVAASAIAAITQPTIAPPCGSQKMGRYSANPPPNILSVPHQHAQVSNNKLPIQLPTQPVPMVNGVTIKSDPSQVTGGSYIALDPNTGLHYKVEVPNGQLTGDLGSDPLAAIMHETIFTETSGGQTTMFTTENGHVIYTTNPTSTVSVPALMNATTVTHQIDANDLAGLGQQVGGSKAQARGKKRKQNNKENTVVAETVDELPCQPDDEDLNTPYPCAHCNKTIKGRVMLQAHQYQEHFDNPELSRIDIGDKHACRVCLKLFTRNSDVKAHILRVHCGDRRYPCSMCGKRFKESTHLRKHLYTHTGERPHYCSLCEKGFQTSSDLKRHKRTRVHQERVEQVKGNGDETGSGADTSADASTTEYGRWVDEDEDSDVSARTPKQMKSSVDSTAQALLTNITQPVSLVTANGQTIDSIIDMKVLGQPSTSGSPSSMPAAPSAVPVTSSWGPEPSSSSVGHFDLKTMSSSADVDMAALIHAESGTPVTSASNIVDASGVMSIHHQQQLLQQQGLSQGQDRGQVLHSGQQLFLPDHQGHISALNMATSQDLSMVGQKKVGDLKGSLNSPVAHDEDERLTVVEDDESGAGGVA